MTLEEAIRLLDPKTSGEAIKLYKRFGFETVDMFEKMIAMRRKEVQE